MEEEIRELEKILKSFLDVPVKRRREIMLSPVYTEIQPVSVKAPTEHDFIIEENIQLQRRILEYKKQILNLEATMQEYKTQIDQLAASNDDFKSREKELRDAILRAKGSIRVLCRMRPTKSHCSITFDDRNINVEGKNYMLDHVFDLNSTQNDIYTEINQEIECVMEGFNVCIFAYGQTGSGKTFTMYGTEGNEGIIFRSLNRISILSASLIQKGYDVKYNLKYIEVYNENITDLISNKAVTIVHDSESVRFKDYDDLVSDDINKIIETVRVSSCKRRTEETNCNSSSSRSHSVFILEILVQNPEETRRGSLCLIDLAGSERLNESKAENERLKETQHINKSLSALGNVIMSLKRKDKHIPFRDSKLTHLMQEYLSGKSRTTMIVNVNPENSNETVCSLRFAIKVSECSLGSTNRNVKKYC